jgi:hypothetical protein
MDNNDDVTISHNDKFLSVKILVHGLAQYDVLTNTTRLSVLHIVPRTRHRHYVLARYNTVRGFCLSVSCIFVLCLVMLVSCIPSSHL